MTKVLVGLLVLIAVLLCIVAWGKPRWEYMEFSGAPLANSGGYYMAFDSTFKPELETKARPMEPDDRKEQPGNNAKILEEGMLNVYGAKGWELISRTEGKYRVDFRFKRARRF